MSDDKYVVIKRDEYVEWFARNVAVIDQPKLLEDAVVIRTQDIFAASGLYAYAHTLLTHCELLEHMFGADTSELRAIADYFFERAHEAEHHPRRKLPD